MSEPFDLDAVVVEEEDAPPFQFTWGGDTYEIPIMAALPFDTQLALETATDLEAVTILLTILYFAVCLFLIVVVLLQHGKGADIGVALGAGASNTVFGARGAGNFLTKLTTASAILFMVLAFTLARFSADDSADDLLETPASEAPPSPESSAPPAPEAPTAPPSEPGGAPSGFESIETPPAPPAEPPPQPDAPAPPTQ